MQSANTTFGELIAPSFADDKVTIDTFRERRLFIAGIISLFTIYFAAVPYMQRALDMVSDSAMVSVPFFLAWLAAALLYLAMSGLPAPTAGLRRVTRQHVLIATVGTLVLVGAATVLLGRREAHIPTDRGSVLALGLYVAFVPVQEYIARGVLLGGLLHYFSGRWVPVTSCIICAALYSALHLYLGWQVVLLVFLPGLFWSYLYYQSRSLLLVSASHLVCGLFCMYVLGV